MKIAYLQVYNDVDWVGHNIDQTMQLCDVLMITEGSQFAAFPEIPERSDDGTLDVISDKMQQYKGRITLTQTTRKHQNYRKNQCDNFNRALELCKPGDYFIPTDADKILFEDSIDLLNEYMAEGKLETIKFFGAHFAFSFDWILEINGKFQMRDYVFKKMPGMYFKPTHNHQNAGKEHVIIGLKMFHHYKWLKSAARMKVRHKTSGMYPGMLQWFKQNWTKIKLVAEMPQKLYHGNFVLRMYDGDHPKILDDHPFRHIKDIRALDP
jgi:hypothetical protein